MLPQLKRMYRGSSRQGKTMFDNSDIQSPELTSQELLNFHVLAQQGRIQDISKAIRRKRQGMNRSGKLYTTQNIVECQTCMDVFSEF